MPSVIVQGWRSCERGRSLLGSLAHRLSPTDARARVGPVRPRPPVSAASHRSVFSHRFRHASALSCAEADGPAPFFASAFPRESAATDWPAGRSGRHATYQLQNLELIDQATGRVDVDVSALRDPALIGSGFPHDGDHHAPLLRCQAVRLERLGQQPPYRQRKLVGQKDRRSPARNRGGAVDRRARGPVAASPGPKRYSARNGSGFSSAKNFFGV